MRNTNSNNTDSNNTNSNSSNRTLNMSASASQPGRNAGSSHGAAGARNGFPHGFHEGIDPEIWSQIPANRNPFSTRDSRGRRGPQSEANSTSTRPESESPYLPNGSTAISSLGANSRAAVSPNRSRELPPPLSQQVNGQSFFSNGQSANGPAEGVPLTFGQTTSMYNIAQAANSSRASSRPPSNRPRLGSSGIDASDFSFLGSGRDLTNSFGRNASQTVSNSNSQAVSRNSSLPPSRHGVEASPTEPNFDSLVNPNNMRPTPATSERPGSGSQQQQHSTINFGQFQTTAVRRNHAVNAPGAFGAEAAGQTYSPGQRSFNTIGGNRPGSGSSMGLQPPATEVTADDLARLSIAVNNSLRTATNDAQSGNGFNSRSNSNGQMREQNLQASWEAFFAQPFGYSINNGSSGGNSPQTRSANMGTPRNGGDNYLSQIRQDRSYGQTGHGHGSSQNSAAYNQYHNPWQSGVHQQQQTQQQTRQQPQQNQYVGGLHGSSVYSAGMIPFPQPENLDTSSHLANLPQHPRSMAGNSRQNLHSMGGHAGTGTGTGTGGSSSSSVGHGSRNQSTRGHSSSTARSQFEAASAQDMLYSGNNWTERFRNNPSGQKFIETAANCTLSDVLGNVARFCGDQAGSRFLQDKLEGANSDEKETVFKELLPNTLQLSSDPFGNYVIQKFFEHGTQRQKEQLANKMLGKVKDLSMNMYGCRCIQKAFEHVLCDQQALLVRELRPCLYEVSQDQHGNHVVQKAIERLPRQDIDFIIHGYYDRVLDMSNNSYGCRVIQRLLEVGDNEVLRARLTAEIRRSTLSLVRNPYGNYVVQHVIEHGMPEDRQFVVEALRPNLLEYMHNKFSSNVVEKAILYGTEEQLEMIIDELVKTNSNGPAAAVTNLRVVMNNNYGNYVIQKLLKALSPERWDRFAAIVKQELEAMMNERGGVPDKKIVEFQRLLAEGPNITRTPGTSDTGSPRVESRASRASTTNSYHHPHATAHMQPQRQATAAPNGNTYATGNAAANGRSILTSTPPLLTGGEPSPQSDGAPSTSDNTLADGASSRIRELGLEDMQDKDEAEHGRGPQGSTF